MEAIKTDICVIGAGSGGLSVAAGAVQMGARVVLIEAGEMGGDCLNYGCVPSKALIAAADRAHLIRSGGLGVAAQAIDPDYARAMEHVQSAIATIAPHDSQARFEKLGCRVIRAHARFVSPRVVEAGGVRIEARRFVIATGSRPAVPRIDGLDRVPFLTNETIWALRTRPKHLIVLGGGPIGVELAQAHRRLGSDVTVVEVSAILGKEDAEAASIVRQSLRSDGVQIVEGAEAVSVVQKDGGVSVSLDDGREIAGTHLLVATGRKANVDRLDLEKADVERNEMGVVVDAKLRSTNRRVYVVGDAAGGMQFTHVAGYHGGLVVRALCFGLPARLRQDHLPRVTYTRPELAQIGQTEAEARARYGARVSVIRHPIRSNDRAVTSCETGDGFIRLMVVGGKPVGVTIVGPDAGELIAFWCLAISAKLPLRKIVGLVAPYPTLNEVNKSAAGAYFSPKLFENPRVRWIVRTVQKLVP